MSISGTNEATQSVPFGTPVATGDANAAGSALTGARSDHVHKGVVANEAWTDWTPTLTNMTPGSGTVVAKYAKLGRTVHYRFVFTLAADSSVGSNPAFSLPVAHATMELQHIIGSVSYVDANGGDYFGRVLPNTTGLLQYLANTAQWAAPSSSAPFTWATGDQLTITGTYEAAS